MPASHALPGEAGASEHAAASMIHDCGGVSASGTPADTNKEP